MGSGKSDILIPLFACKKASANTLPILVIPEEHIDTDAAKYQRYAAIFFG